MPASPRRASGESFDEWDSAFAARVYDLERELFLDRTESGDHPKGLRNYNREAQGEIVRHAFLLRRGATVVGAPPLAQYETLLPF